MLHHFGSKDGLRQACDEHVAEAIRGGTGVRDADALAVMLDDAIPVRRYLGRALLDGMETAARLVDRTQEWLAEGEAEGWVRPTDDPRARAVTYVSWQLAPLVLGDQVGRLLGGDTATAVRGAWAGLEMLTGGLFTDDRWLALFSTVGKSRWGPC
ncbi:TetR family transcriptional regulator [Umezawaea sp. Da 62-37]|uniref:TetR family transcriptional regulator n=1 Tax=Umezawaea sp. Da 62-37 TaxID=3075927 RepID=UPI0028F74311|nr:TetR family transcriptional regulator [Umezawaea sp. Da 62-37]WNV85176.1 TetR family transcriptional regulator [Umezawaea sp. Da 62-37]